MLPQRYDLDRTAHRMDIGERQHIRFSLDIPAWIFTEYGEKRETRLQQISIGGCFTGWEEDIYNDDEFRMEIKLPNGNFLPLQCKALYRFDHTGVGVKFIDVTPFEQELISDMIADRLDKEGVPLHVDPFTPPPSFESSEASPRITDIRQKRDAVLHKIMSSD